MGAHRRGDFPVGDERLTCKVMNRLWKTSIYVLASGRVAVPRAPARGGRASSAAGDERGPRDRRAEPLPRCQCLWHSTPPPATPLRDPGRAPAQPTPLRWLPQRLCAGDGPGAGAVAANCPPTTSQHLCILLTVNSDPGDRRPAPATGLSERAPQSPVDPLRTGPSSRSFDPSHSAAVGLCSAGVLPLPAPQNRLCDLC